QPEREVREQRALHLVAAVQPYGGAAARAGERVEPRLERGGAAHGSPAGPRPGARLERPVKVVDREHPEYGGVPLTQRRCGGRKRGVGRDVAVRGVATTDVHGRLPGWDQEVGAIGSGGLRGERGERGRRGGHGGGLRRDERGGEQAEGS